jgi:hypothetical protein
MIHPIFVATIILALKLIILHGPNGQEIDINPHEVSSIRDTTATTEGHFGKGVKCLLFMTNGKVNGVVEHCDDVRTLIEAEKN